jgi:hypothetical protein
VKCVVFVRVHALVFTGRDPFIWAGVAHKIVAQLVARSERLEKGVASTNLEVVHGAKGLSLQRYMSS